MQTFYFSCVCLLAGAAAAADPAATLLGGLAHSWSFDRDAGDPLRDEAGEIELTQRAQDGFVADGVVGEAVEIGARGGLAGASLSLCTDELTIAGWIRYEAAASTDRRRAIFSNGSQRDTRQKPWALHLEDGHLAFFGTGGSVRSRDTVPEGRWVHVAAIVEQTEAGGDARNVRLYVDGQEAGSGGVSVVSMEAEPLVGATHHGGNQSLCGRIDELAIWSRALSAAEIAALGELGRQGRGLRTLVGQRPTISLRAEPPSEAGAVGGTFVVSRDGDGGEVRVQLTSGGLATADTDYPALAKMHVFPAGTRELRIPIRPLAGATLSGHDDVKLDVEPGMFYEVAPAASSARVWLRAPWPAPAPPRPKKLFAHYMACYPVAAAATVHHRTNDPHKTRHDGPGKFDRGGDRWRNWPLVPDGLKLSLEEAADLDIRRAIRAGFDGFAVDAWAGGENAKQMFRTLLKVAEEKDYPFEITVCLDPAGLSNEGMIESLRWIVADHGASPKLARRDGRPLVFGYLSGFIGFRHGAEALAKLPEFAAADLKTLTNSPDLRKTKAGWKRMADGQHAMAEAVGTPLFFHYCMEAFFHGLGGKPDEVLRAATFMAGEFGAVGQFKARGPKLDRIAEAVRAAGAEWSQPMFYQYENLFWGGNSIPRGSSILRDCWEAARRNDSTLIQFVTWNDYTENTHAAPGYETRYAILDLNRHFADWWRTGSEPRPDRDKVFLFFRKYPVDAKIFPFQPIQPETDGVIEVLTLLTKPARVRAPGRAAEWDAPAGLSWKHLPVTPGPVAAEVVREGSVVARLESPEPITDRPFRQINSLCAISTECGRHWREDFGDAPPDPLTRGLYADDDGDGLPNWFEMYWFGKFLDWSTATVAEPDTIGAGGKTLLQHYHDQTDPTGGPQPVTAAGS